MQLSIERAIVMTALFAIISEDTDNSELQVPGWMLRYIKETYLDNEKIPLTLKAEELPDLPWDEYSLEG